MSFPAQSWWLEMLHMEKFLKKMSWKYRVNCLSHILGFLIQYLDHNSGLHMHNSGLHMQRKIEISSIKVRKPQTGLLNGEYLRKEWIRWDKSVKCNVKARNEYMQQKKLRAVFTKLSNNTLNIYRVSQKKCDLRRLVQNCSFSLVTPVRKRERE